MLLVFSGQMSMPQERPLAANRTISQGERVAITLSAAECHIDGLQKIRYSGITSLANIRTLSTATLRMRMDTDIEDATQEAGSSYTYRVYPSKEQGIEQSGEQTSLSTHPTFSKAG